MQATVAEVPAWALFSSVFFSEISGGIDKRR